MRSVATCSENAVRWIGQMWQVLVIRSRYRVPDRERNTAVSVVRDSAFMLSEIQRVPQPCRDRCEVLSGFAENLQISKSWELDKFESEFESPCSGTRLVSGNEAAMRACSLMLD